VPAESFEPTDLTRVRRHPERARYDAATIHAVLDQAPFCNVGFVDRGRAVVLPMLHARIGDRLLLHGASESRLMRSLPGTEVCVTATIFDGLVLARSAAHHSANFRSVVVFGRIRPIDDSTERLAALEAFTEKLLPGRWKETRPPTEAEVNGTAIVEITIEQASAKVRSGPPSDDAENLESGAWAGVVPFRLAAGEPEPAPGLPADVELPPSVRRLISG
jgi:nitroimidazol reductase NimA-like FMN-containing flavoprotein (pyridoxamine 5'-phosphate oxidase superfamily)